MDLLALILAAVAIIAALLSTFAARPTRFGTLGVAVACLAASWICQLINLTGVHAHITHH
jgi:hypothetical protein